MLRDAVRKLGADPHSGKRIYGRVSDVQVANTLAYVFEAIGTLMATPPPGEGPLSGARYLMPFDLPPEVIADAPAPFLESLRLLAG